MCSTFHRPNRLETLFSCHHWERSSYWIEHHTERPWDDVLLCRSLDFSVEQDCFCFTFPFDLASFSSVIHLLFSYAIYENILNMFAEWISTKIFFSQSIKLFLSSFFPFVRNTRNSRICLSNISFSSVQQTKYLSNENSHNVKIFQLTSRRQTQS